jgi:dTDP-glucose pyrophosphorylase
MKPTLVILAAGTGSRYGSFKQWDAVGPSGETLMDYSVYDALRAGAGKVVIVVDEENSREFRESVQNNIGRTIKLDFAFQDIRKIPAGIMYSNLRIKPWGTVHAMLMTEEIVHEPFIVINADDFYGFPAYIAMVNFLHNSTDPLEFGMVSYPVGSTCSGYGSVSRALCRIDSNGYLLGVDENYHIKRTGDKIISGEENRQAELDPDMPVSMNIWGFKPSVFPKIRELFRSFIEENHHSLKAELVLSEAVNCMIKSGFARVKVLCNCSQWFGITYKEDKHVVMAKIRELTNKGDYPGNLFP